MAAFCHAKNKQMEEIQWQMLKDIFINCKQWHCDAKARRYVSGRIQGLAEEF